MPNIKSYLPPCRFVGLQIEVTQWEQVQELKTRHTTNMSDVLRECIRLGLKAIQDAERNGAGVGVGGDVVVSAEVKR
jgi:hypothetical protein